jgi:glycosyltransferase involved in cell wall biosynthesis
MTHSPLFSIILPTKNNQKTIKRCLQSIENQTYKNIEVIFVDNFSDDETLSIAKSFENTLNIKIFQYGPERHKQREFGFEQST